MPQKMIRNLRDLTRYWHADDARGINRRAYKDTACGASVSIQLRNGRWLHNGTSRQLDRWNTVRAIRAFTVQTIVEGSEATVDSPRFVLPVTAASVDAWVREMEAEAARLWTEANGEDTSA